MAMVTAEDSPVRSRVRGLVLDYPILDWQATLSYQGHRHGLPAPLVSLTERLDTDPGAYRAALARFLTGYP